MPAACANVALASITHSRSQNPIVSSAPTGTAKTKNPSGNAAAPLHRRPPPSRATPQTNTSSATIDTRVCCPANPTACSASPPAIAPNAAHGQAPSAAPVSPPAPPAAAPAPPSSPRGARRKFRHPSHPLSATISRPCSVSDAGSNHW